MANSPYKMTLDLNVLNHLGINLYSNVAAVLTETVANAWDADASEVRISLDKNKGIITIYDNGVGMTVSDMNNKYLKVGYRRRDQTNGQLTKGGRQVMGRKGLGKLSLFSIADTIEVESFRDGERHGCLMSVEKMNQALNSNQSFYAPEEIPKNSLTVTKGTRIKLSNLKKGRLDLTEDALRARIARRFSVLGVQFNFKVFLNDTLITIKDRKDLDACQFVWVVDGTELPARDAFPKEKLQQPSLCPSEQGWNSKWKITGWIGTAFKPKDLTSDTCGNMNGIVLLARGRLFHENIMEKIADGRMYTKYITGQIQADFLDAEGDDDIATSDRQRIQEDDPRCRALIGYLKNRLNEIEGQWSKLRSKKEVHKLLTDNEAVKGWFNTLQGDTRKSAEKMLGSLCLLHLDNEEDRKVLYRHGILAFERIKLREQSTSLSEGILEIPKLLELLADLDSFEASLYADIVHSRLNAIKEFQGLVDENQKEKVLQKYLFDHLWLLDPSWERASGSEVIEERLIKNGTFVKDATEKEKLGRVDIAYKTIANKHMIIELKRANRKVDIYELLQQGDKYISALKKVLQTTSPTATSPDIEVIFVLGKTLDKDPIQVKNLMNGLSSGSRIVYYDTLMASAQKAYAEFLEAEQKTNKLAQLLHNL